MRAMIGPCFVGLFLLASCGSGKSATPQEACADFCAFAAVCADEFGLGDTATCSSDCVQEIDFIGVGCLDALTDTVVCLDTCDFASVTEADARRCEGEGRRFLNKCESLLQRL